MARRLASSLGGRRLGGRDQTLQLEEQLSGLVREPPPHRTISRVGPDTLHYEITVTDPTTWHSPWTALVILSKTDDAIFEYACHEGNYGMEGIMTGARAEENAGAAAQP